MKLDSKLFDSIRVKPDQDRLLRERSPRCEHPGCDRAGAHRAPKGRGHEGEYHTFCIKHVRDYNRAYNYFKGMSDDAVIDYQRSALTGHRPTWSLGYNTWYRKDCGDDSFAARFVDPFGVFSDDQPHPEPRRRPLGNAERQAIMTLGLEETATPEQAKARYKALVKRHHPDANGGARDSEQKLREIIQAYDYLRSTGFC